VRRARVLAWLGVAWHAVEAFVAIAAGVAAGSIALIGFGADSVVEGIAGIVVIWRFAARREATADAERRAQRLIAASFFAIAVYVSVEALLSLIGTDHPQASWVGIGLSIVTLVVMPPLATAKGRVARQLGSSATHSEGRQNMLCAYLSAALLAGLGVNALFGWWWGDPAAALLISGVAVREGVGAWRGDACCDTC
jgi:divalent metal cation (Fe/Co/Zn/Cd) transporter